MRCVRRLDRQRISDVIDIPFAFGTANEAVAPVESIGRTFLQCAEVNGHARFIGARGKHAKDVGADAFGLHRGMNVEVLKVEAVGSGTKCVKTDAITVEEDEFRVVGIERSLQPLTSAFDAKAPEAFERLAHCVDSNLEEFIKVSDVATGEGHAY